MGLLLTGERVLVTQCLEKSKMLNAAFVSVFTGKKGFQESQPPAARVEGARRTCRLGSTSINSS